MKIIDLSHKIYNGMPVHAYDAPVRLNQDRSVETDGYNGFRLQTGLHAGTHIDAPLHFIGGGKRAADLPPECFCGAGRLIDVRGLTGADGVIRIGAELSEPIMAGDIVLLYTGFDERYGTGEYYSSHPVLDMKFAKLLVERGIKMLGMDMFSPDKYPYEIHKFLLGNGIIILENLRNLNMLAGEKEPFISALPLAIEAEGSPVRAIAVI